MCQSLMASSVALLFGWLVAWLLGGGEYKRSQFELALALILRFLQEYNGGEVRKSVLKTRKSGTTDYT